IRRLIEERFWSPTQRSYTWHPGGDRREAKLLLLVIMRDDEPDSSPMQATADAIHPALAHGPPLPRCKGEDGSAGGEGASLCCSFWLVEALTLAGRRREAEELMDELIGLANDVGLYAEEVDPTSGAFLGNFPQGLVHLALISAAMAMHERPR